MRYAIYFSTPESDPLTRAAANWLGRDAFGGRAAPVDGRGALVAEAARYGFHGTLKAPFHLRDGKTEAALFDAFDAFAAATPAFTMGELVIGQLGPFFALVPGRDSHRGIGSLADACVREFEPFRAPLADADITRRKPDALPERQRRYLLEWGYPYVFEEFRFHMTLTGPVAEADRTDVRSRLAMHFGSFVDRPLEIGELAIFAEPERGAPFSVVRTRPLARN